MKISPVGAESFHAGGRTDRLDEANVRFFVILRTRLKQNSHKKKTHFSTECKQDLIPSHTVFADSSRRASVKLCLQLKVTVQS